MKGAGPASANRPATSVTNGYSVPDRRMVAELRRARRGTNWCHDPIAELLASTFGWRLLPDDVRRRARRAA